MHAQRPSAIFTDPLAGAIWLVSVVLMLAYAAHLVGPLRGWLDTMVIEPPPMPLQVKTADAKSAPLMEDAPDAKPVPATPEALLPAVAAVATWLDTQQKLQGQIVTRVRASRDNRRLILHLTVSDTFMGIEQHSTQVQVLKAIVMQWALQCEQRQLLRRRRDAHLEVIAPSGDIVGGGFASTDDDVWFEPDLNAE